MLSGLVAIVFILVQGRCSVMGWSFSMFSVNTDSFRSGFYSIKSDEGSKIEDSFTNISFSSFISLLREQWRSFISF